MTIEDPPKPRGNPRAQPPDRDPSLHANRRPGSSLVESLGDIVDEARQLNTDFGLRPYRVFSIVVEWSGGEVGKGAPTVIRETEFLPTPLVQMGSSRGIGGVDTRMTEGGLSERGMVVMTEVSPRLTEDDIQALFHLQPVPQNLDAFIEIRMDARDGATTRRRFAVQGVPDRRADKFDWRVKLRRQNQNEHRNTSVDNVKPAHEVQAARRRDRW